MDDAPPPTDTPHVDDAEMAWSCRYQNPARSRELATGLKEHDHRRLTLELFFSWREQNLEQAVTLVDELSDIMPDDDFWRIRIYAIRAAVLADLGLMEHAHRAQLEELAIAQRIGDLVLLAGTYNDLGVTYEVIDPSKAIGYYLKAVTAARQAPDDAGRKAVEARSIEALAIANIHDCSTRYGLPLPPDLPSLEDAAAMAAKVWPDLAYAVRAELAIRALCEGRTEAAARHLDGIPPARDITDVVHAVYVARAQALCTQAQGDSVGAVATLESLRDRAGTTQQQEILETVADLHAANDEHAQAFEAERERTRLLTSVHALQSRITVQALEVWHRTRRAEQNAREAQERISQLEEKTFRDGLTGLGNRWHLDAILTSLPQIERHQLAVIDVDTFKMVNDSHGHTVGDEALRSVAEALQAVSRPGDACVRCGGDEFVVIRPYPSRRSLAQDLAPLVHLVLECGVSITSSIGVAYSTGSLPAALDEADQLMYQAKQSGGGRIVGMSPALVEMPAGRP